MEGRMGTPFVNIHPTCRAGGGAITWSRVLPGLISQNAQLGQLLPGHLKHVLLMAKVRSVLTSSRERKTGREGGDREGKMAPLLQVQPKEALESHCPSRAPGSGWTAHGPITNVWALTHDHF